MLSSNVKIGEKVIFRGGTGGLLGLEKNRSITVKMLPWGIVKTYKSVASTQIRRLQPELG